MIRRPPRSTRVTYFAPPRPEHFSKMRSSILLLVFLSDFQKCISKMSAMFLICILSSDEILSEFRDSFQQMEVWRFAQAFCQMLHSLHVNHFFLHVLH